MATANATQVPLEYKGEHYDYEAGITEEQRRTTESEEGKGDKRWWYLVGGILVAMIGNVFCLLIICFRRRLGIKRREIQFFITGIVLGALIQVGMIIGILAATGVFKDDHKKGRITVTGTNNGVTIGVSTPSILGSGFGFEVDGIKYPDEILAKLKDDEVET